MAHRLSSPPLIKGIDGIVSRPPNEVNYSALNEESMEARKQPGNEIFGISRKFGISGNMTKDVKQVEKAGKIKILNRGINQTEIDMMENKVEDVREEEGVTREAQQQEHDALMTTMTRAADTAEKEKKEEREELYRKEKEEREELYRNEKEKEKREELYRKKYRKYRKKEREEFHRKLNLISILSDAGVHDFWTESAKGYEILMEKEAVKEDDGLILEEEEIVEYERKNTEAAAEDEENKDLGATGVIVGAPGATEDDSTSTTDEDGAVNEDDGLILEEEKVVETKEKIRRQRQKMKKMKIWVQVSLVPRVPRRMIVTVLSAKTEQ